MKKSSLILIILSVCISEIYLSSRESICQDQIKEVLDQITTKKKSEPQFKGSSKYYLKNRNVEINLSKKNLTINFNGIQTREEGDLKVIYTANFYDKETIGIDYIQHLITETPLYSHSIKLYGEEAKKKINWKLKIQENDNRAQVVQIQAKATLNYKTEILVYNTFSFTYEKKAEKIYEFKKKLKDDDKPKVKRTFEFWLIFGGMIGAVILTYIVMTIVFAVRGQTGRPSVQVNNMHSGLVSNDSVAESSKNENV